MFRNLIFDWSGTLCDDLGLTLDASNHVFEQYGRKPLSLDEFRAEFQLPYPDYYARVLPDVPIDEVEDHFRYGFKVSCTPVCILPHAREFMLFCRRRGIRCFVLTSVDAKAFDEQCRELGMFDFFEAIHAGVRDKEAYIGSLMAQHGLRAEETAFIGDMQHDMAAAHCAGVMAVGVLTGYNDAAQLVQAKPDLLVPDLRVLRLLVDKVPSVPREEDVIRLNGLELVCSIGVPDEERAEPQRLTADVELVPSMFFAEAGDDLARTVDYDALSKRLMAVAAERPRRLVETLVHDLACCCVEEFGARRAAVEVHKFILPEMRSTSVRTCVCGGAC